MWINQKIPTGFKKSYLNIHEKKKTVHLGHCQVHIFNAFTESQNHRMAGIGRDLWGSSSPTPLPKQIHLEQAAQRQIYFHTFPSHDSHQNFNCTEWGWRTLNNLTHHLPYIQVRYIMMLPCRTLNTYWQYWLKILACHSSFRTSILQRKIL